jgi:hypothetical protein
MYTNLVEYFSGVSEDQGPVCFSFFSASCHRKLLQTFKRLSFQFASIKMTLVKTV